MIFWEYGDKKFRDESGISKLGTNTLEGLLIITDIINIIKVTHRLCFWGYFQQKGVEKCDFCDLKIKIQGIRVEAENFTQIHLTIHTQSPSGKYSLLLSYFCK